MRYFVTPLLCWFSITSFAQSKHDYQHVMDKFVKFYNKKQGNEIVKMWEEQEKRSVERIWGKGQMDTLLMKYGTIKSFAYDSTQKTAYGTAVFFKVKFSKLEPNGTTFIINKRDEFQAFQLFTSEPKWLKGEKKK